MPKTKTELKGKLKKKGKQARGRTQVIKIVVQAPAGKAPSTKTSPFKTGMNRDIPMGGSGGSPNLLANLLASRQAQPAPAIQTPDVFKVQQDIKSIKEDIQRQRREYPVDIPQGEKVKIKVVPELEPDAQIMGQRKKEIPKELPELQPDAQIMGQRNDEYSAGGARKEKAPLKKQPNPMSPEQLAKEFEDEYGINVDFSHSLRGMEPIGANPTDVF